VVRRPLALALIAIAAAISGAAPAQAATDASGRTGEVRFVKRMTPEFDRHVTNTSPAQKEWMNKKFWRSEVFNPFFDGMTAWYGKGWVYKDLYAIGNGSPQAAQNPDWILKSQTGEKLYIPWGCGNNWCPQYAGDITNPAFRANWIANLRGALAKGYKGAWIDDVNLERRVSNATGTEVAPYSPSLGRTMTADDWRRAMADFTEQIRREIPNAEILHNSIWYAGQGAGRDSNPEVQRQIASADYINIERGFNDGGLTGGNGEWSVRALHGFVDRVHALGKGVIVDAFDNSPAGMEYSLANYLLVNAGKDGVGEISQAPDSWWKGWDSDLGTATSGRYDFQGTIRRDFTNGIALVNEPGAPARTIQLPQPMTTIDGATVTQVTIGAGRGAVLFGAGFAPGTPDAAPITGTGASAAPGKAGSTTTKAPVKNATVKGTAGTGDATQVKTCKKTRVTYPTLRWNTKRSRFVNAKGSALVCIDARLKRGTKAHKAAVKKAKRVARSASLRKAQAARKSAVHA
jgi:hypothetical protein